MASDISTNTNQPIDEKESKLFPPDEEEYAKSGERKLEIIWKYIVLNSLIHIGGFYGVYLLFGSTKWQTMLFTFVLFKLSGLGITAGAHRLWSHRSYKATKPLRILLIIFNSLAYHFSAIDWARYHRVHHKYSDTDLDPHNSNRGFIFAHVGWLMCEPYPEVREQLRKVDISDLYADPLLVFQKRHFVIMGLIIGVAIPTLIPVMLWDETWKSSFFVATLLRLTLSNNSGSLINSLAHTWGYKPYDKNIAASENMIVSAFAWGEGYHNYHHAFPWDYKAAELGIYKLNFTTKFLELCEKVGLAYDLKTVSKDTIRKRIQKTGDQSLLYEEDLHKE